MTKFAVYAFVLVGTLVVCLEGFAYAVVPLEWMANVLGKNVYVTYGGLERFPLAAWDLALFAAHPLAFHVHVFFGPLALLFGLSQFRTSWRQRHPRLHRRMGYLYAVCSFISLPTGMYMGAFEYGGVTAFYGFLGMGGTALVSTALAVLFARRGDWVRHREWAVRSYFVMWSSVVIFRLLIIFWIPFEVNRLGGTLPDDFGPVYLVTIFLSWSLALLAADVYLSFSVRYRAQKRK